MKNKQVIEDAQKNFEGTAQEMGAENDEDVMKLVEKVRKEGINDREDFTK